MGAFSLIVVINLLNRQASMVTKAGGQGGASSGARQRKGAGSGATSSRSNRGNAGSTNMWKFYTEDSPGIKVGPVPVLVMSLVFIASVFLLHILGKYSRV